MLSKLMFLGLLGLGFAIPTPTDLTARNGQCNNFTWVQANFDDQAGLPGAPATTVLPTPYNGLLFQSFAAANVATTNAAPGVVPQSGSGYAISGARTETTSGSAEWTVNYARSTVKSFSPSSFYYGCMLDGGNGAAALPTTCNIAITGYAKGDNNNENVQVASQEFEYNPSTMTGAQQMVQGFFNSQFQNLQYILIQYTLPGGTSAASADFIMALDNAVYSLCY